MIKINIDEAELTQEDTRVLMLIAKHKQYDEGDISDKTKGERVEAFLQWLIGSACEHALRKDAPPVVIVKPVVEVTVA